MTEGRGKPDYRTSDAADEFGMTAADWADLRRETVRQGRIDRWRAFKACWFKPVTSTDPSGRLCTHDGRSDEWTMWQAVKLTVALVLNRHWTDEARVRLEKKRKGKYTLGVDMAFWDSYQTYGGYDVMVVWLYPGCRASIFSDGECLM